MDPIRSIQLLAAAILATFCCLTYLADGREFKIDYETDTFLMDGEPFRYVSGSVHYFRMPRQYWRDRLRKVRAAGLNAISTYVEWSMHEINPGVYNFSGDANVTEFIKMAQEEGLYVILRPGPYICAERDMGGLPFWLLSKHPDMYLRSSDERYTKYVQRWMSVLLTEMQPLLYGNGGPIILVQVENEYGSYISCDNNYTTLLRDLFLGYIQNKAVLFTTDGGATSYLKCGKIPDVYATVDFGPGTNVTKAFGAQREYEKKGPLVNSEFYPGWLTHWGENRASRDVKSVIDTLQEMFDVGANVNFYMFYGGTNFGFTAGANFGNTYQSDITSYDYDAPITEEGVLTEKYYAIRDLVTTYLNTKNNISVASSKTANYGSIVLGATASLFAPKIKSTLGVTTTSLCPQTFESLNQNFGYLLYETQIQDDGKSIRDLNITEVHDFAHVFINQNIDQGTLSREEKENRLTLSNVESGDSLGIIVENLGRINFGSKNNDTKGILSKVLLDGKELTNWSMTSFELNNLKPVEDCYPNNRECNNGNGFIFYMAKFSIGFDNASELADTFIDVSNLSKGLVFVNGYNLGRYWPTKGPQSTLYLPGVYLNPKPQTNTIIIMDEFIKSNTIKVSLVEKPIYTQSVLTPTTQAPLPKPKPKPKNRRGLKRSARYPKNRRILKRSPGFPKSRRIKNARFPKNSHV